MSHASNQSECPRASKFRRWPMLFAVLMLMSTLACQSESQQSARDPAQPVEQPTADSKQDGNPQAGMPSSATAEDCALDVEMRLALICRIPGTEVFFTFDSANLLPNAKRLLDQLGECLVTGAAQNLNVLVIGRTDASGSDTYNERLGMNRAESVVQYLSKLGIDKTRVKTESMAAADEWEYPGNWPYERRVTIKLQEPAGLELGEKLEELTDLQMQLTIAWMFHTDAQLINMPLVVGVSEGIVTLSGTANHLLAKERAVKLAQSIRGVRGVLDTVVLQTVATSDKQLRDDVHASLAFDAATDGFALTVAVQDAIVTLSGSVANHRQRQLAVHVAQAVRGVKGVRSDIQLSNPSVRKDDEIHAAVSRALAIDAWLAPSRIVTAVKGGAVTLSGEVRSAAQKDLAMATAWTDGVNSVNADSLLIDASAKPSREGKKVVFSDEELKQAVREMLVLDPRVFSFELVLEVKEGAVTISGVVDNLKAMRAAGQDAWNTVGVRQVHNLVVVLPTGPIADAELAKQVDAAFRRDSVVNANNITVAAVNGVVTLTGTVDSLFEAGRAEDLALRANGAVEVVNELGISYPKLVFYSVNFDPYLTYHVPFETYRAKVQEHLWPRSSDSKMKAEVERALYWSPFVDEERVSVSVNAGAVTLGGKVGSWPEHHAALDLAYQSGALKVVNELLLE